jgi:hypothetical protein
MGLASFQHPLTKLYLRETGLTPKAVQTLFEVGGAIPCIPFPSRS